MSESPLQKAPRGLLELLRLKTLGEQPNAFDRTVSPSIDITDFYANDVQQTFNVNNALAALPQTLTQPVTEPIRVLAMAAEMTLGAAAGTRLQVRVGVRSPQNTSTVWFASENVTAGLAAGLSYVAVGILSGPMVIPPGWTLVAHAVGDAGGADHQLSLRWIPQILNGN